MSGNPGGRPKLLGEAYKDALARVVTDPKVLAIYHRVTGDVDGRPTYADVSAAVRVYRSISSKDGASDARAIHTATEGVKATLGGDATLRISLEGFPISDATNDEDAAREP